LAARVLIAEDNAINQKVAQVTLKRAGYAVDAVWNGSEAVAACRAQDYDVVLMDCQMPEMDGFQATEAIRQWEKNFGKARTPIIALTANAIKGDREACLEVGMDDYLCKPLDPKQLIQTLNKMIDPAQPGAVAAPAPAPETPVSDAGAPFDLNALLNRCMGDRSFRDKLLAKFPEQALAGVQKMVDVIAAHDAEQLSRLAHTMKGTAANLSASSLQKLAADFETLGKSGALDEAQRRLDELRAEVDRCVAFVRQATPQPANG
jgi:two-component system sensor histidine kinase/response regulator